MNRPLKIITNIFEAILAVPILGGTIVVALGWYPLLIMLVLHVVTLVVVSRNKDKVAGSILGIITSCLGWIPFLGWIMHAITAVVLLIENITHKENSNLTEL